MNYLRLLKLPAPIQVALKNKEIDMGHARALLTLEDPKTQIRIFNETVAQGYSVRKVEEIVKALANGESIKSGGKTISAKGTQLSEEYTASKIIICSLEQKYSFPVPIKGKEKSAFLSTAMQIWKELWRFWIL